MDTKSNPDSKRSRKVSTSCDDPHKKPHKESSNVGKGERADVKLELVPDTVTTTMACSSTPCCRTLVALLEGRNCSVEMPILKNICQVAFCDAMSVMEIHQKVLYEARGVFLWDKIQLPAEDLEKFHSLKIIVKLGPGLDNIDLEAAGDMGIAVCHVNGYGIEESADTAIGLILDLYRKINCLDKMIKDGEKFGNFENVR